MKKLLATFAAAALTAALPAQATTFSLRTIYVASGVTDSGGAADVGIATSVHCTNLSGKIAQIRVAYYSTTDLEGSGTASIAHLQTITFSTHSVIYFGETPLNTGSITQGVLNVSSTESGMFCSAMVVDAAGPVVSGIALHMVRFNPHPGVVE